MQLLFVHQEEEFSLFLRNNRSRVSSCRCCRFPRPFHPTVLHQSIFWHSNSCWCSLLRSLDALALGCCALSMLFITLTLTLFARLVGWSVGQTLLWVPFISVQVSADHFLIFLNSLLTAVLSTYGCQEVPTVEQCARGPFMFYHGSDECSCTE